MDRVSWQILTQLNFKLCNTEAFQDGHPSRDQLTEIEIKKMDAPTRLDLDVHKHLLYLKHILR